MKLSDVSPLAAMVTGEGALGKAMAQGFGGLLPAAIARNAQKDAAEEERQRMMAAPVQGQQPMKKGGKVSTSAKKMAKGGSASSRADGIAQRGKTRGRFV